MKFRGSDMTRLQRIQSTLFGSGDYCAEPLDIEDARWLYSHLDGLMCATKMLLESHDLSCAGEACRIYGVDFARSELATIQLADHDERWATENQRNYARSAPTLTDDYRKGYNEGFKDGALIEREKQATLAKAVARLKGLGHQ